MKKIITSLGVIGVVTVLAVGATGSYFSDTEKSVENTFSSADILDMKISDNDEGWGDGVTATWTAENMFPGDEWEFLTEEIGLAREAGSADEGHLEITADYKVDETVNPVEADTDPETNLHPDEMAKEMLLTRCIYRNSSCIDCLTGKEYDSYSYTNSTCGGNELGQNDDWKIEDQNGDGKISFYDLKNDKLDNLPTVKNNPPSAFEMGIKFSDDAGDDFQGDQFVLDMIFTLNQNESQ